MSNYPDWVIKIKEKGTFINYSNGKYYLYAAHSERVPGTSKVKRVYDEYLGRITEKDGLIPPKDKVSGDVYVLEYGLSATILFLCKDIYSGFRRSFKGRADFIMIASILSFIYGRYNEEIFKSSYLSVLISDVDFNKTPTSNQLTAIERGICMINDTLSKKFKTDKQEIMLHFQNVYKVRINNRFYVSNKSDTVNNLIKKYNIKWEE